MRSEVVLSVNGRWIGTQSGQKIAIGNQPHSVGDVVSVDGMYVFGHQAVYTRVPFVPQGIPGYPLIWYDYTSPYSIKGAAGKLPPKGGAPLSPISSYTLPSFLTNNTWNIDGIAVDGQSKTGLLHVWRYKYGTSNEIFYDYIINDKGEKIYSYVADLNATLGFMSYVSNFTVEQGTTKPMYSLTTSVESKTTPLGTANVDNFAVYKGSDMMADYSGVFMPLIETHQPEVLAELDSILAANSFEMQTVSIYGENIEYQGGTSLYYISDKSYGYCQCVKTIHLYILSAATLSGTIYVEGIGIALTKDDSAETIASKISAASILGWAAESNGNEVVFYRTIDTLYSGIFSINPAGLFSTAQNYKWWRTKNVDAFIGQTPVQNSVYWDYFGIEGTGSTIGTTQTITITHDDGSTVKNTLSSRIGETPNVQSSVYEEICHIKKDGSSTFATTISTLAGRDYILSINEIDVYQLLTDGIMVGGTISNYEYGFSITRYMTTRTTSGTSSKNHATTWSTSYLYDIGSAVGEPAVVGLRFTIPAYNDISLVYPATQDLYDDNGNLLVSGVDSSEKLMDYNDNYIFTNYNIYDRKNSNAITSFDSVPGNRLNKNFPYSTDCKKVIDNCLKTLQFTE
jgi:hypothetical protein